MAAANYDITIEQGATYQLSVTWKDENGTPINLSGFTARMQVRKSSQSDDVILTLTSDESDQSITLGGALGTIDIEIPATVTEDLTLRRAVYDLEMENAGNVTRLIQGSVNISPEVTK